MNWSLCLSVAAILIAIGSLLWNILWSRDVRRRDTHYANSTLLAQIELALKDVPSAIRFRGFSEAELRAAGLTAPEFAYLLANVLAGWVLYEVAEPDSREPFSAGSYRYKLFQSEHTQRAWPLIKQVLDVCPYTDRIDNTIAAIQKSGKTLRFDADPGPAKSSS